MAPWILPVVKLALPWLAEKVFARSEGKLAGFLASLGARIARAEADNPASGEVKRAQVWNAIEAEYPEVRELSPSIKNLLNELVLTAEKTPRQPVASVDVSQPQDVLAGIVAAVDAIKLKCEIKSVKMEIEF